MTAAIDKQKWGRRISHIFNLAGITEITTPMGKIKAPYPKMLRHTCAVWFLRHGERSRISG